MRKIDFPENYSPYHIDREKFFVLDQINDVLIQTERDHYGAYFCIPGDKEVECFVMDYDKEANTYRVNFEKEVKVKMNLLEGLPYGLELTNH
jgi:hypothetical protein